MSRGLGDVYKRQSLHSTFDYTLLNAVSYTHLTLPTILLV
ncbi:hypothetical protein JMUB7528_28670 [Staphylococcus aureus]